MTRTIGPCLCGDTECVWCGNGGGLEIEGPSGYCEVCGVALEENEDPYVCAKCAGEIKRLVRDRGE